MKNLKIWTKFTTLSFQQTLSNKAMLSIFLFSKFIRVAMFLVFLYFMFGKLQNLGGFNVYQIVLFYLVFNLIDTFSQFLFRYVYHFRQLVISGGLDFVLLKPYNPLIKVLLGGADVMDLIMLAIILLSVFYIGFTFLQISFYSWIIFGLLVFNSLLISAGLHILVLGLGIITFSVDHLIMIYRDITALMRIPVDLYIEPLRTFITFIIPLGIIFTFPAKLLLGLLSWQMVLISFFVGIGFLYLSILFWRYSLIHYQSASS